MADDAGWINQCRRHTVVARYALLTTLMIRESASLLFRTGPAVVALTSATALLAVLALLTPFGESQSPATRVGFLLAIAAALEVLHGIRRSTAAARREASTGAVISMVIAVLLINAPFLASTVLLVVMAGFILLDAARYGMVALRATDLSDRWLAALAMVGNAAVALLLVVGREWAVSWTIAVAVALRIFGIAWNIAVSPVHTVADANETVVAELGLSHNSRIAAMTAEVEAGEAARAPVDRGWIVAFVATLFAIHIGRMGTDGTLLGLLAPAVAVAGDMFVAALITLLVINPLYLLWRWPTRWIERPMWRWYLAQDETSPPGWIERLAAAWLRHRLRFAVRMRAARYSLRSAMTQALQHGLPLAAVLAATVPVWGMSWYFDTENWAAGMWNSWAESRTTTWRAAMVRAVLTDNALRAESLPFAVHPAGIDGGQDFSFIVIGDTGEGDASQHILRDQLLAVSNQPDVRFVVISSDVVYPVGAMRDYEAKFWLPFKGVTKPTYAIPGNHDWYDALEAFAATFLEPAAARASMRARVETDLRLTSTTEERIEGLIRQAAWLREQYRRPHRIPARSVLRDSDRRFRAHLRRHGRRQASRRGTVVVAAIRARAGTRQARHGSPRSSLLRRREPADRRLRGLRRAPGAPAGTWRRHHHGRRHPRSRVLRRAASRRPGGASLRQRRRRRVSQLRDIARVADSPADVRRGRSTRIPKP